MDNYDIVPLFSEIDEEEVVKLFRDEFLAREPTSLGLGATPDDTLEYHIPMIIQCLKSGISLGAKSKLSGELVGMMLNKILTLADKSASAGKVPNSLQNKFEISLHSIYSKVESSVDIFDKYNVQKVLDLAFLCTHKDHGGKGIGKALIERTELLGLNSGCQLATVIASHIITQAIFSKRGYDTYLKYDFSKNGDIDLNKTEGSKGWYMMSKRL